MLFGGEKADEAVDDSDADYHPISRLWGGSMGAAIIRVIYPWQCNRACFDVLIADIRCT